MLIFPLLDTAKEDLVAKLDVANQGLFLLSLAAQWFMIGYYCVHDNRKTNCASIA